MNVTIVRILPALVVFFILLSSAPPAYADGAPSSRPRTAAPSTAARAAMYSPRVRRSTIMYLRLRLLELREAGLDRARAAIERRLSIDELLAEPAATHHTDALRNPPSRPQRSAQ